MLSYQLSQTLYPSPCFNSFFSIRPPFYSSLSSRYICTFCLLMCVFRLFLLLVEYQQFGFVFFFSFFFLLSIHFHLESLHVHSDSIMTVPNIPTAAFTLAEHTPFLTQLNTGSTPIRRFVFGNTGLQSGSTQDPSVILNLAAVTTFLYGCLLGCSAVWSRRSVPTFQR